MQRRQSTCSFNKEMKMFFNLSKCKNPFGLSSFQRCRERKERRAAAAANGERSRGREGEGQDSSRNAGNDFLAPSSSSSSSFALVPSFAAFLSRFGLLSSPIVMRSSRGTARQNLTTKDKKDLEFIKQRPCHPGRCRSTI